MVTVEIWLLAVGAAPPDDVLGPDERAQAARFRHDQDRASYITAHGALRRLLGARLGLSPAAVSFARLPCPLCGEAHGRPVVAGPRGESLQFSISHSRGLVMVGLAPARVGVDVEKVAERGAVDDVSRRLHPAEIAEVDAQRDDGDRAVVFTRLWARKEAYLKGLGTGLARDLALDYLGEGMAAAWPAGWSAGNIDAGRDHAAGYAVEATDVDVVVATTLGGT